MSGRLGRRQADTARRWTGREPTQAVYSVSGTQRLLAARDSDGGGAMTRLDPHPGLDAHARGPAGAGPGGS